MNGMQTLMRREQVKRDKLVLRMLHAGKPQTMIAKAIGVSPQRANQIIKRLKSQ